MTHPADRKPAERKPAKRAPVRIIAAMTVDRLIGAGDRMPWDLPDEYQHFLDSVRDGAVIMGRTSYEIFGADLTEVESIVLTRGDQAPPGTHKVGSLDEAVRIAGELGRAPWIAGGASIYRQALVVAEELHLSIVTGRFDGDAHFPAWERTTWRLVEERPHPMYLFRRYVKRNG